ncbi:MAG: glycoside hydrolase family 97 catalytic domain-containing protein [Verrucomicrobiota bacterium]
MNKIRLMLSGGMLLLSAALVTAAAVQVKSPNGRVVATFVAGEGLNYSVKFRGQTALESSALGITVDGVDLSRSAAFTGNPEVRSFKESYPKHGVHAVALNHFRSALIHVRSGEVNWQIEVRAYDDGVAYRYQVPGGGRRRINGESSEWRLPVGTTFWHQSSANRSYEARYVSDIAGQSSTGHHSMAPMALKFTDGLGYGLVTEANLVNYSDMALHANGTNSFTAAFHDDPNGWEQEGEIVSPWRVLLLAADLNALVNSDLIKNLCPAPPQELAQAAWIKPGRSIWHWLSCYCAPDLPAQKWWIDRTREMGYEYYLIDDGWRNWNGGGDNAWQAMEEMVAYAKSQNVAIWAWVDAKYVVKPEEREAYFKRAKAMGIVGLKVDFPKPANTVWVQWYEDVLRDAAKYELMINFHGAVKPTGRERTWPNEMSREAVAGREQGKSPALHDTTLPFLRYVQGHADFTPTMFMADRLKGSSYAHELAMAIVFTSPYLCFGDNPTNYLNSVAVDVLKALPAVWEETRVLPGSEIGELAAFARRHGDQWFIGAINDLTPRRESVSLGFLAKGDYRLVELADAPDRHDAFVRSERIVTRKDTLTLPLRKDGGYVAWLVPVTNQPKQ